MVWSSTGDAQWVIHPCGDARGPKQRFLQRPVWWRSSVSGQGGPLWVQHGFCLASSYFQTFATHFFFWLEHLLPVFCSWRNSCRQGLQEPGTAHPRPGEHGGHEGSGVGRSGRTRPRSDSSGREGAETRRAGGENRSHDGQRRVILQTRSRCTCLPMLSPPRELFSVLLTRHRFLLPSLPQMMLKYKDKKWYQLWWQREEHRTLHTWKSWRSLFFFSQFFFFSPLEARLNRLMLLFSAQYHTLCFYLSHWRTAAQQRTPADPALAEQNETEPEGPND